MGSKESRDGEMGKCEDCGEMGECGEMRECGGKEN